MAGYGRRDQENFPWSRRVTLLAGGAAGRPGQTFLRLLEKSISVARVSFSEEAL